MDSVFSALQYGALGLLALVLVGLGYLIHRAVGPTREYLTTLNADQKANVEAQRRTCEALTALTEATRAGFAAIEAARTNDKAAMATRIELLEQRVGAVVDRAKQDVVEVVRERTSHVTDEVGEALDDALAAAGQRDTQLSPRARLVSCGGGPTSCERAASAPSVR